MAVLRSQFTCSKNCFHISNLCMSDLSITIINTITKEHQSDPEEKIQAHGPICLKGLVFRYISNLCMSDLPITIINTIAIRTSK